MTNGDHCRSIDPWLGPATRLAHLLHEDGDVARKVVANAFGRFESAFHAQRKRLYYAPDGGASKRCKAYLPPPALLQMLLFAESQPFERLDDSRDLSDATLALRYVKHLVFIAMRRNSFHVALAVFRVLFAYATPEAMKVYDALLDERDFVKEDYYYRARKRLLLREMSERFPSLERIHLARAEERFAPDPDQERWSAAVFAAMAECTPWDTRCDDGRDPEMQRLHVLIHPPCLERLVRGAGLPAPDVRLAMPRFDRVPLPVPWLDSENATVARRFAGTMTAGRPAMNDLESEVTV